MYFIKKIKIILLSVIVLMLVYSGVGSNNSYAATKVTISQSNLELNLGKTFTLEMKNTKEKVNWISSNDKVASITSSSKFKAKIKANSKGNSVITAKIGNKKYTCKVKVLNPISINKSVLPLDSGKTFTLVMRNTKEKVSWTSSNSKVASVTSSGDTTALVKADSEGKAIIKAKVGKKEYICTVEVKPIKINRTNLSLDSESTFNIFIKGTKEKVNWSSNDNEVASVTSTGDTTAVIKANSEGTTIITAKVGEKEYTCIVEVNPITLSDENLTLNSESIFNILIRGTKAKVNWSSSDNEVASIASTSNTEAVIKANNEGTTTITAKIGNKEYVCTVKVLGPKVYYIGDREVSYYSETNAHKVFFSMLDANEQRTYANMNVNIKIINSNNEKVYERSHSVTKANYGNWTNVSKGSRYLASINIPTSELIKGNSKTGKIYVTVAGQAASFNEYSLTIDNLPYISGVEKSTLELPEIPKILNNYNWNGVIDGKVGIYNIQYKFEESYGDKVKLTVNFEGTRIRAGLDDGVSKRLEISYKLFRDGFVIDSGTAYTPSLNVGEKFKDEQKVFYSLEPGIYKLELFNTN